ncbi:lipoprotein [Entomohabitans teleogrylli]|uniref:lipoprotein n=1 Tax=Entomohabitans teleogrylli TaxID=1384589 RepID=UPI00073D7F25|nr:lipoprotein [Entomohabitans teleogrylli]
MRRSVLAVLLPCSLLLSACTTVTPAYKDIGSRSGPCAEGGPDAVAQQFYDYRIAHPGEGITDFSALRPWLSDSLWQVLQDAGRDSATQNAARASDIFASYTGGVDKADVASASTIPNTDARNIPLRVNLNKGSKSWQDEVLMVREGQCWAVDDVRYLGAGAQGVAGSLRQSLERR